MTVVAEAPQLPLTGAIRGYLEWRGWTRYAPLLQTPEGRRSMTKLSPELFSMVYLPGAITDEDGRITFGEHHAEWFDLLREWAGPKPGPRQYRHALIAPRGASKTTIWYKLGPLWAGAHGHVRFIAGFSVRSGQAEQHLASFKREIEQNKMLKRDFPDFCKPARRPSGQTTSDTQSLFQSKTGFVFSAHGFDAATLGLKIGDDRPSVLLLDDIEPKEGSYSDLHIEKNLADLQSAILPLQQAERGWVILTGTTTRAGSIVDQLCRTARFPGEDVPKWIRDGGWRAHYYPVILTGDDGTERSLWPAIYPMDWINKYRHTREFQKEYQNSPVPVDSKFWTESDIRLGTSDTVTRTILSVDPAVSARATSDFTGLAVVGYSPIEQRCYLKDIRHVREGGTALRQRVLLLIQAFPEIRVVLVETNQGGDLWNEVLHNLPPGVKLKQIHQKEPKVARAARALNYYQRGKVFHERDFPDAVLEMVSFDGREKNRDDMVDAVVSGVNYFLDSLRAPKPGADQVSYV